MQQVNGFDESRNNKGMILNLSEKTETAALSIYVSASTFSSRFLRVAKIIERIDNCKNRVFLVVRMEVRRIFGRAYQSKQARYGLQLPIETIPM
jgi:hypothetical protein